MDIYTTRFNDTDVTIMTTDYNVRNKISVAPDNKKYLDDAIICSCANILGLYEYKLAQGRSALFIEEFEVIDDDSELGRLGELYGLLYAGCTFEQKSSKNNQNYVD